jgi:flagellar FliL protein
MAEDLEEESGEIQTEGEAPPKRNRRRLLIFIAVPILVVILAVVGAYIAGMLDFIFKSSKPEAPPAVAQSQGEKSAPNGAPGQSTVFYDLPEILVNLNSQAPGRKQNFLKIRVSLELQGPLDVPKVEAVIPRIIDNFQVYLRELRVDDLQGSAGMLRLREELLARVNAAVKPAKVNDVLFKEILVQ